MGNPTSTDDPKRAKTSDGGLIPNWRKQVTQQRTNPSQVSNVRHTAATSGPSQKTSEPLSVVPAPASSLTTGQSPFDDQPNETMKDVFSGGGTSKVGKNTRDGQQA